MCRMLYAVAYPPVKEIQRSYGLTLSEAKKDLRDGFQIPAGSGKFRIHESLADIKQTSPSVTHHANSLLGHKYQVGLQQAGYPSVSNDQPDYLQLSLGLF